MTEDQLWPRTNYKPWGLQKELQKGKIPHEGDIKVIAANIKNARVRALFVMLYLTAGRVSELCYELKKKDLTIQYMRGRTVLLINMPNRKHKTRHFKDIPIPLDKEEVLLEYLNQYLKTLRPDQPLFDFGHIYSYQMIRKYTGWNNHWIRHLRLTHLVVNHDFNEQLLVRFAGWTNSMPAAQYMELRWGDILSKYIIFL